MRSLLTAVAATALLVTGCADSGVTRARLEVAVQQTFDNLLAHQRDLLDGPPPSLSTVDCRRGVRGAGEEGPGDDWVCAIKTTDEVGAPKPVRLEVSVKPDGCFIAEGAPLVLGNRTLVLPDGSTVSNPVVSFDGCFDAR